MFGALGVAYAACSPGIPCTDYNIYDDPDANIAKADGNEACDGNFMNQIYSKAFLEASREVIMAEQIIHKPDSVLEYTCFDQYIAKTAHEAGPIFSESQRWNSSQTPRGNEIETSTADDVFSGTEIINNTGATDGFDDQSEYSVFELDRLDNVLEDFLLDTLEEYIDGSFSHTFLGEGTTIDNDLDTTSIGSNTYNCSHMSTIWSIAKCLDFGEDDRFRSFEHLVNADPRSIPTECSPNISTDVVITGSDSTKLDNTDAGLTGSSGGFPSGDLTTRCPPAGGLVSGVNTGITNDQIRVANNCDTTDGPNAFASFDFMKTLNDLIKGYGQYMQGVAESGTNIDCSPPLPTGVPVITYSYTHSIVDGIDTIDRQLQFHYEHLCPNPGCYYDANKVSYTYGSALPASTSGSCVPY